MEKARVWNRDELVVVLALYHQIPFGKMHSKNPDVIAVAKHIGRTPSAVALRLSNFASLDPELSKRGIKGMANISRDAESVWCEFHDNWELLVEHLAAIRKRQPQDVNDKLQATEEAGFEGPTESVREVKTRLGQSFFRSAVFAAYDNRCCITGIATPQLLRASHIVPWSADPTLRTNPSNGLCLNALHDAAFDRGLISLTDDLELILSKSLIGSMPPSLFNEMFQSRAGLSIRVPERRKPRPEMVKHHRENIFRE